jgi:hypothetical protein
VDAFAKRLVPDWLWEIVEPLIPAVLDRLGAAGIID